jgi:tetratricopeptide (TPR) repeat protein
MANRADLARFHANRRVSVGDGHRAYPGEGRVLAFRARNPAAASWAAPDIRLYQPTCKRPKQGAAIRGLKPRTNRTMETIMRAAANVKTLPQEWALFAATPAVAAVETDSQHRCERVLDMLLTQRGDAFAEVERVLADDPGCVFGHCLRAALIVRAETLGSRSALAASIAAIEAACPHADDPARRHAVAARAWLDGDSAHAVALYGAILIDRPHDVLALAVAHALDFHLGRRRAMRDRIAKVLPRWTAAVPGYASVLAMYAFALEENGQYRRAEKIARRARALDPEHSGAIHVIAHVMEMQGRVHDGLAFLAAVESAWGESTGLSIHLAWHRALFHLDAGDPKSALAIYDRQIATTDSVDTSALADGSALLWWLYLQNIEVSDRWRPLADRWATHNLADARPFYVVHAMMAFAAAGRTATALRLLEALPSIDIKLASSLIPEDALAAPLREALLAFARSDYAECVKWLTHVRHIAHRCGGSLAQCDLIHLTFTEAASRARRARLGHAPHASRRAGSIDSWSGVWERDRDIGEPKLPATNGNWPACGTF